MIKFVNYPDNSFYAVVGEYNEKFQFRINTYEDLWKLNQVIDVYNHNNIKPTVIIPNLIDAQADKRFENNQSSGLRLVCQFLNNMNANFEIFHPHNPEVIEALIDNVRIFDNKKFIQEVLMILNTEMGGCLADYLILMSSDSGGFKPLMKICDNINWRGETYSASKSRKYEDKKSKLIQIIDKQDFKGKDILLIDDICVYGGTFKGLATMLKERNCGKLYLAVSHMTVQNLGDDPITNYFDVVFTTNSKFDFYYGKCAEGSDKVVNPKNLKIHKL